MDKETVLDEIRRTTHENDGAPLGIERFTQETGIKQHELIGRFWVRWGDALREAGLEPNILQAAYDEDFLLRKLIELIRDLGHFPVRAEFQIKRGRDTGFPSYKAFARLGSKASLLEKLLTFCEGKDEFSDIRDTCAALASQRKVEVASNPTLSIVGSPAIKDGFVYMALLKLGRERRYKIGKAVLVERRTDQISLQLPENLELLHAIKTDDAYGIESYWHKRFAAKNTRGEWFSLSQDDIRAFKLRKFM